MEINGSLSPVEIPIASVTDILEIGRFKNAVCNFMQVDYISWT